MRYAVVSTETRKVVNVILAGPDDSPPLGTILVELADDATVDMRWEMTEDGTLKPTAEYQAELDAIAAAEAQQEGGAN